MFRNRLYYRLKPLLPASLRMAVRRWFAVRKRERVLGSWPILPGSEVPPRNWPGWPEDKQFAFVLTHDVESQTGVDKCRQLMELEMKFGFRSSFNFIPEGGYTVPGDLLRELRANGFEVGVHDLYHDGNLYRSRKDFSRHAHKINRYLKEWGAVGFRSGSMFHNLEWLHDLEVAYDTSTFDTDPFEPQPDGVNTIFPFWVPKIHTPTPTHNHNHNHNLNLSPRPSDGRGIKGEGNSALCTPHSALPNGGYVELPYTLPQDSTLFLLFNERHPDIWFQKLDWIARHGGMALLNVHPDYLCFEEEAPSPFTFPVEYYERFLNYILSRYSGEYWHALPRQLADCVREQHSVSESLAQPPFQIARGSGKKPKIWIDLDNTPHVPFFEPILEELQARDFPLLVTARDAFQVCDLADKKGLKHIKIGRHHGKHRLLKGAGLAYRAFQLAPVVLREKPALGVSHGSRSQLLLSNCLRLPTLLIEDYEFSQFPPLMRPTWVLAPEVIPDDALPLKNGHIRHYTGIKEDVYAWKLKPDARILPQLGLVDADLIVTVRPPATEAHYHNPHSERLFEHFMERACCTPRTKVVLLPRNHKQSQHIRSRWPAWFAEGKTAIPPSALDGLNLIWHSDLVVSGGGTMNREAAALGVPVYSIFRGSIGAVDRRLSEEGRLVMIESLDDVTRKIRLTKRSRISLAETTSRRTLLRVVDTIEEIAQRSGG